MSVLAARAKGGESSVHGDEQQSRRLRALQVRARVAVGLKYVSLVLACVVVLLPLVSVFLTSLKTDAEVSNGTSALSPPHNWFNYHNYVTCLLYTSDAADEEDSVD